MSNPMASQEICITGCICGHCDWRGDPNDCGQPDFLCPICEKPVKEFVCDKPIDTMH